jgi:hypothetical protein
LYSSFIACAVCAASSVEPDLSAEELHAITHRKHASATDTIKSFIFILGV